MGGIGQRTGLWRAVGDNVIEPRVENERSERCGTLHRQQLACQQTTLTRPLHRRQSPSYLRYGVTKVLGVRGQ